MKTVMFSISTSYGLPLQYSGQVDKCFPFWFAEDVTATAKFINSVGSIVCVSSKWYLKGQFVLALLQNGCNILSSHFSHAKVSKHFKV